jgi:uncharacterized membrane protein
MFRRQRGIASPDAMDDIAVARAVHVLSILHWFGGVAFVTSIVLPAVSRLAEPAQRLALFEAIERRFAGQVRVSVPLAGLSGAYMAERLEAWQRFIEPSGWWLTAMAIVWLLFMAILFVLEPLVLHDWFNRRALGDPDGTFALVHRLHWILLAAGAATVAAGVLGVRGALG